MVRWWPTVFPFLFPPFLFPSYDPCVDSCFTAMYLSIIDILTHRHTDIPLTHTDIPPTSRSTGTLPDDVAGTFRIPGGRLDVS